MNKYNSSTRLFLIFFILYAFSPVFYSLPSHRPISSLQAQANSYTRDIRFFPVHSVFRSLLPGAAPLSNDIPSPVLVKKKRAVIKNLYYKFKLRLLKQPLSFYAHTAMHVFLFASNYPFEHLLPCNMCEGLLLYSGVSPPFPR